MAISTLNDIFTETLKYPRPSVMKYKKDGQWIDIPPAEFEASVRHLSAALRSLGVKREDRVAILSENRPEWTLADLAIMALGGVTVPIYPTLMERQIEYILNDSGSVLVVASNEEQLTKLRNVRSHCPTLRHIIVVDPPPVKLAEDTRSWADALKLGAEQEKTEGREKFDELLKSRKADDLATIVYTSGTTGNQKGAMLTHGNIASNVLGTAALLPLQQGDTCLNILPLSHILERMADFSYLYKGATIAYAQNVNTIADDLGAVQPHVFAAVPRIFEKMQARMMTAVSEMPAVRAKLFHWALSVGAERVPYRIEGKPLPPMLAIKSKVAEALVFKKIHQRLGGRVRFVLSGGAPLSAELAAFFVGAGVEILEGYGLTETSPVITVNTLEHRKLGTVGKAIPRVEVKIASDGEILTRGPHVMMGYFNNPEATQSVIDSDGWFHTGDIGELDAEGFLKITDRKKDLIINAYGKNIAPQPLEGLLKTSALIETPVLIGDKRKFLAALIVPNFDALRREAAKVGVHETSDEKLVADERVHKLIANDIEHFNESLDRHEKIRKFRLLPREFTIEDGEITPSMKVKRKVIDEKYRSLIDEMFRDDEAVA